MPEAVGEEDILGKKNEQEGRRDRWQRNVKPRGKIRALVKVTRQVNTKDNSYGMKVCVPSEFIY